MPKEASGAMLPCGNGLPGWMLPARMVRIAPIINIFLRIANLSIIVILLYVY
jgi:hypothetical protein